MGIIVSIVTAVVAIIADTAPVVVPTVAEVAGDVTADAAVDVAADGIGDASADAAADTATDTASETGESLGTKVINGVRSVYQNGQWVAQQGATRVYEGVQQVRVGAQWISERTVNGVKQTWSGAKWIAQKADEKTGFSKRLSPKSNYSKYVTSPGTLLNPFTADVHSVLVQEAVRSNLRTQTLTRGLATVDTSFTVSGFAEKDMTVAKTEDNVNFKMTTSDWQLWMQKVMKAPGQFATEVNAKESVHEFVKTIKDQVAANNLEYKNFALQTGPCFEDTGLKFLKKDDAQLVKGGTTSTVWYWCGNDTPQEFSSTDPSEEDAWPWVELGSFACESGSDSYWQLDLEHVALMPGCNATDYTSFVALEQAQHMKIAEMVTNGHYEAITKLLSQ